MPDRGGRSGTGPRFLGRPTGRARAALLTVVVLGALMILFAVFAGFWTDWLWYRSVSYASVFRTRVGTEFALFGVFGVLMAAIVGGNLLLAHRLRPPLAPADPTGGLERYREGLAPHRRRLLIGVSLLIGLAAGASAAGEWRTWLQFVNRQRFGVRDPEFHLDASFYTFQLPWYRFLLDFGFAAVLVALFASLAVHYLYGGLRLPVRERAAGEARAGLTTGGRGIATPAAQVHLCVLLGVFVSLKAVAYWLDRYSLAVKGSDFRSTTGWAGLRYVDANAYLPAKTILFCIAVVCALLFFVTLVRRTLAMPLIGLGLMVLSAILIGGLYPAIVQRFEVKPNEQTKEEPYIKKNIEATRYAYGIDGVSVDRDYNARRTPDPAELAKDALTTSSIRLLDPNVVSPTFQQLQKVKGFYSFPRTLDVDRYPAADGTVQDTVVGLRELNLSGVTASQRNWVNDHFKYTHGFGMVAGKGTTATPDGKPVFTSRDLPPKGELGPYQPRIYFGEETTRYSVVGGKGMKEVDYSSNAGQKETTYSGGGGVALDGLLTKAAFAVRFSEPQLLYSGGIKPGARILYDRTPRERVEKAAPWLSVDGDPYPAVVDGRIQWIVDGYTTSDWFPYSSRTTLGTATADSLSDSRRAPLSRINQVNYIRNSVKATVDAYTGEVRLYQWDAKDPVLRTWMKAFPGTVKPRAAIPADLLPHLRYPQDMFKVQRDLLTRYHVTDPQTFFNGTDIWKVPTDPTDKARAVVPPYYQTVRMPGQDRASFSLTTTYVPASQTTLAGFMAVDSDPGPDYGRIRILQLPANTTTAGPQQVQSLFSSNDEVSRKIYALQRSETEVVYGNLLTLPVGGGLLYVEPVYVKGDDKNGGGDTSYPLLRKVFTAYGDRTAFEDDLGTALGKVLGTAVPAGSGGGTDGSGDAAKAGKAGKAGKGAAGTSDDPKVKKYLDEAKAAIAEAEQARRDGDWARFGAAQKKVAAAVDRALDAEAEASAAKR